VGWVGGGEGSPWFRGRGRGSPDLDDDRLRVLEMARLQHVSNLPQVFVVEALKEVDACIT